MSSLNKVMIIGRLGRDPEMRYTQAGKPVCSLNVATDEGYTNDRGEKVDKTEWHKVVFWDRQAETCSQYLAKGSKVAIEGKLRWSQWERDGIRRSKLEVFVDEIEFMSTRSDNAQPAMPLQEPPARQTTPSAPQIAPATYPAIDAPISIYDDDIPF